MNRKMRYRSFGTLLFAVITLGVAACDSSSVSDGQQAVAQVTTEDLASAVVADLGMSAEQRAHVVTFIDGNKNTMHEAGFSWRLAANLQATLTAEQKARLLERANSPQDRGGFGMRHGGAAQFGRQAGGHLRGTDGIGSFRRRGPGAGLESILTDEQREQVQAIRESYRDQMDAIRSQVQAGEITREEAHNQLQEIHESLRSEIDALLTEEQRTQIEEQRAERAAEREARREEARAARNEVLGLDAEGSDALDTILDEFREAAQALREQMRASDADRDQIHAAVLALRQARDQQVGELLDEVGFEIFQIHEALRHRLRGTGIGSGGHGAGFGGPGAGHGGFAGFGNRG